MLENNRKLKDMRNEKSNTSLDVTWVRKHKHA